LKDNDQAYEFISRAQDTRPSDVRILNLKTWIQRRQEDMEGKIDTIRQARMRDPRNAGHTNSLVFNLMASHRYDEAKEEIGNADFQTFELEHWQKMLELTKCGARLTTCLTGQSHESLRTGFWETLID
jgi:hypothetical protein